MFKQPLIKKQTVRLNFILHDYVVVTVLKLQHAAMNDS